MQSYAQAGEDLAIKFALEYLGVPVTGYLDIGAYSARELSNTCFFYARGDRGVLVEPHPDRCRELRRERPRDTVIEACVTGVPGDTANYYTLTKPGWDTVCPETVAHVHTVTKGDTKITGVSRVPVVTMANLFSRFPGGPTFVSLDVEGVDLAVLQSVDFDGVRPALYCVETLVVGTRREDPRIAEFLASKGYVVRGGSLVNTIFVDGRLL